MGEWEGGSHIYKQKVRARVILTKGSKVYPKMISGYYGSFWAKIFEANGHEYSKSYRFRNKHYGLCLFGNEMIYDHDRDKDNIWFQCVSGCPIFESYKFKKEFTEPRLPGTQSLINITSQKRDMHLLCSIS